MFLSHLQKASIFPKMLSSSFQQKATNNPHSETVTTAFGLFCLMTWMCTPKSTFDLQHWLSTQMKCTKAICITWNFGKFYIILSILAWDHSTRLHEITYPRSLFDLCVIFLMCVCMCVWVCMMWLLELRAQIVGWGLAGVAWFSLQPPGHQYCSFTAFFFFPKILSQQGFKTG